MIRPQDRPSPRWFTIPAQRPFASDLAAGLCAQFADQGPEALSKTIVLLPSQRGARALSEAFLQQAGSRALLLPQIRALGDLDEGEPPFEPGDLAFALPPAITPLRRRFELAALAASLAPQFGRTLDPAGAFDMGDALGRLLDSLQIEEVDAREQIDGLADIDLAQHWHRSADVIKAVLDRWPKRLASLGVIDIAERRVKLIHALADRWGDHPPETPLIAAGSTGSTPSTARLLSVIASCPLGAVVLPGLDEALADTAWNRIDEQHPQANLKRLLDRAGVLRNDVVVWGPLGSDAGRWRRRLINEALRPAEATDDWLGQIARLRSEGDVQGIDPVAAGFEGLSLITARTEAEAAMVCALLLREALETPDATAALITPDLNLSRRVAAQLLRWDVRAEASAGQPLTQAPAARLALAFAQLIADPDDPVLLLAVIKHPLVRMGLEPPSLQAARGRLERLTLRGPRVNGHDRRIQRLDEALRRSDGKPVSDQQRADVNVAKALADRLQAILVPILAIFGAGPVDVAAATLAFTQGLEHLTAGPDGDNGLLWSGPAGEALSRLLAALMDETGALIATDSSAYADLLSRLMVSETIRQPGAVHPRVMILGAIEARLVRADRLVLAGLEEGTWPRAAEIDPFLSRSMRKALGLPPPERRIGLSAHDFAQAACAPEVHLVHCERKAAAPQLESRWLWRLRTLARGANITMSTRADILDWARRIDAPQGPPPRPERPNPKPPRASRPRELSVTRVERWLRDPYETYARYILNLRVLDLPDQEFGPRERGTAIHAALEHFGKTYPESLPDQATEILRGILEAALIAQGLPEADLAREQALAANIAERLIEVERSRRPGARLLIEETGALDLWVAGESFRLTAKADRLEVRRHQVDIIDFKTGNIPTAKQVAAHLAPQLTLTAAILQAGGFAGLERNTPGELVYVPVKGGRQAQGPQVVATAPDSAKCAAEARANLERRVAAFQDPQRGYLSRAMVERTSDHGDYDHLARVKAWTTVSDDNGDVS